MPRILPGFIPVLSKPIELFARAATHSSLEREHIDVLDGFEEGNRANEPSANDNEVILEGFRSREWKADDIPEELRYRALTSQSTTHVLNVIAWCSKTSSPPQAFGEPGDVWCSSGDETKLWYRHNEAWFRVGETALPQWTVCHPVRPNLLLGFGQWRLGWYSRSTLTAFQRIYRPALPQLPYLKLTVSVLLSQMSQARRRSINSIPEGDDMPVQTHAAGFTQLKHDLSFTPSAPTPLVAAQGIPIPTPATIAGPSDMDGNSRS